MCNHDMPLGEQAAIQREAEGGEGRLPNERKWLKSA